MRKRGLMPQITSKFEGKEEINFLSEVTPEIKVPDAESVDELEEELVEEPEFDHYEIHEALLWIDDVLERGLIRWVLVGDVAKQIYGQDNPTLIADRIEIMVLRKYLTDSGRSMSGTWLPGLKDEHATEIRTDYEGVPIYIKIIDEDPGYLGNPDKKFYYISDIYLPNPFEEYLNDRNN